MLVLRLGGLLCPRLLRFDYQFKSCFYQRNIRFSVFRDRTPRYPCKFFRGSDQLNGPFWSASMAFSIEARGRLFTIPL
ncbi:hypothetical protein CIPAW_13G037700 [Carya illinoinensis]|uniref:Uncharacterized protein n=1 Tax=Carya illinoinensis TaxID=32201 RepID=A0A8T1NK27_CARIL|nr:hypothetical protein CIPAW_13G037700 [Carya illinoinensis]